MLYLNYPISPQTPKLTKMTKMAQKVAFLGSKSLKNRDFHDFHGFYDISQISRYLSNFMTYVRILDNLGDMLKSPFSHPLNIKVLPLMILAHTSK